MFTFSRAMSVGVMFFIMCSNCSACDVAVYATQHSQCSVTIINKAYYTNKFDVSIVNLSENNII